MQRSRRIRMLYLVVTLSILIPSFAYAFVYEQQSQNITQTITSKNWWNSSWNYQKLITVNHSLVESDLNNFPMLISGTYSELASHAQDDFDDVCFVAWDNQTKLDHEIETYDSSNGYLVAWVRVNLTVASETKFWMYYGNSTCSNQENPSGVWSNGYKAVYHLNDGFLDSSGNNNHGTNYGSTGTTGNIANARDFYPSDGVDYIDTGTWSVSGSQITLQAWIKSDDDFAQNDPRFLSKAVGTSTDQHVWMMSLYDGDNGENRLRFRLKTGTSDSSGTTELLGTSPNGYLPDAGSWYLVAMTYNGSNMKIIRDGLEAGSTAKSGNLRENAWSINIGNNPGNTGTTYASWDGKIDEVRISSVARSTAWIKTEYNNQNSPSTFYSVSPEEVYPSIWYESNWYESNWYDSDWDYRKKIIIDHTKVEGSTDLTSFPLLISITDSDLASKAQDDGDDILFTSSDEETKLSHEIEKFNGTTGELLVWVKVPTLYATSDTILYMYYGNPDASNQQNASDVWSSNYVGIWHLGETTGGTNAIKDSTANDNDGTDYGNPAFGSSGKIDSSIEFTADKIDIVSASELRITGNLTISLWFKAPSSMGVNKGLFTHAASGDSLDANVLYSLQTADADQLLYYHEYGSGVNEQIAWNYLFNTNTWYYVTVVRNVDATDVDFYVNGNYQQTYGYTYQPEGGSSGALDISNNPSGSDDPASWGFNGFIDEVRISNTTHSGNWIATEYNNQNDPSSFHSVEDEEIEATNWDYRKKITIDHTKVEGSTDLTSFPLLISITDSDLASKAQDDGDDILFTSSDEETKLSHEIEKFNGTTGELLAWVKMPILYATSNTTLYMYYGNPDASNQQDSANAWDSNYAAVWHLQETVGGTGAFKDSTANGNNGTDHNSPTLGQLGQIGNAVYFDGTDDYITAPNSASLDITGNLITMQAWVRMPVPNDYDSPFIVKGPSVNQERYMLGVDGDTNPARINHRVTTTDGHFRYDTGGMSGDTWHFVVGVYEGTLASNPRFRIYLDGSLVSSNAASGNILTTTEPVQLGKRVTGDNRWYNGNLDEVRISDVARTDAWIQTEYNNQYDASSFCSFGIEELPNWDYRKKITIDSTKVDGSIDLTGFPVLINITDSDLASKAQDDGDDIVFAWGATKLSHEIEKFNGSTGELLAWVKVPTLYATSNTTLYMYYGNPDASNQQNASDVWDSNYAAVWHLEEDPSGTPPQMKNSVADSLHGTGGSTMTSDDQVSGEIGESLDFDAGVNDYVAVSDSSTLEPSILSLEAWVYRKGQPSYYQCVCTKVYSTSDSSNSYYLGFHADDLTFHAPGDLLKYAWSLNNEWHHIAGTYDGSTKRLYVDGVQVNSNSGSGSPSYSNGPFGIGNDQNNNSWGGDPFWGIIDEVRVSSIARSAAWIRTEYNNQNDPSSFYSIGLEEIN